MIPRSNAPAWLKNPILGYGAAGALAWAAVLVRTALNGVLEEQSRYALLLPVVLACAVYGGFGPGLFAALLGACLSFLLLIPPGGSTGLAETKDLAGLFVYLLMAGGILWLTHREISERRRRVGVEERLANMNAELEAKVAERTAELKAANDELEGFCYSMAHDLRTPSRAIAGNARIMLEDHADKLSPELSTHLQRINRAAIKLGALVDGLLTYARLAKQDLQLADVDVAKLTHEVVSSETRRSKVEVQAEIDDSGPLVRADERQMRILVKALVENALLYRTPGQPAVLRLRWSANGAFVLEDEGIGFDMDYVHKVFQPFERLHRDEAYPGVGMGLANADRVVQRHRGKISIESAPGKGTRVTVQMPDVVAKPGKVAVGVGAG